MSFQDLLAYKKSFARPMKIFEITKSFLREEAYSLTDQIRCSSRSIPAIIAEAYSTRINSQQFYSKLTDSDGENSETQVWLEFAVSCKYISELFIRNLVLKV